MDSSCLQTSPCTARCVTLCQQFVLCIANNGSTEGGALVCGCCFCSISSSGLRLKPQQMGFLPEVDVWEGGPPSVWLSVKKDPEDLPLQNFPVLSLPAPFFILSGLNPRREQHSWF